jgi:hypothetical protein
MEVVKDREREMKRETGKCFQKRKRGKFVDGFPRGRRGKGESVPSIRNGKTREGRGGGDCNQSKNVV